jgi:hypothetical protein
MVALQSFAPEKLAAAGKVRDDRGRIVRLFDPFSPHLWFNQLAWVTAVRREVKREDGIKRGKLVRVVPPALLVGVIWMTFETARIALQDLRAGGVLGSDAIWKIACLPVIWLGLLGILREFRRARRVCVRRVMFRRQRCLHCGYSLRDLPFDPTDGLSVCPECGCAWRPASQTRQRPGAPHSSTGHPAPEDEQPPKW